MSARPIRFTLGQIAAVVLYLAFVCAVARSSKGPVIMVFFLPWLFSGKLRSDFKVPGCAILFSILFAGCFAAAYLESLLAPKLAALPREYSWLIEATIGLLLGAIIGVALRNTPNPLIAPWGRMPPKPPPDETCGPIVWRGFDSPRPPASGSS